MSKITPYNTTDSKKKQVEKMFDIIAKRYDLPSNMGYGTSKHILGIQEYGICDYHRKSFGLCKNYK